ncbi:N-acetyltransferase [Chimaeribacter californicus]|uniref:N-acetyltransferase n=1 Tax=Chimaeribacter californicus TaxID=2060067 RepID=A0A2N5EGT4_9GAMM|nr:GNAT family N-acetyltransferase [Chimaeribacter californicus]PLR41767.1 N-acetyltransferase [Chimaeribacter californicus]
MESVKLKIVKFSAGMNINVENFCCGRPELDEFLKKHLAKQHVGNVLKAYLLITDEPAPEVMGFYTLSGGSYAKASMTSQYKKHVPYREISCITLGRLAVDKRVAGKGFGTQLVLDALRIAYYAADAIGIYSVMVEAKDERAAEFYRKMGFIPLKTDKDDYKFFFPVASIESLL